MPGKIFINYRRANALAGAGRLQDRLARAFGARSLFMDVDHIPAGVDFVTYLSQQVAACDVFLAVIAPGWLDARDDTGQRRIDDPEDFVAIEIAAALARGDKIRVIPVLLDGVAMPKADELPDALKSLARRNAVEVRNAQFGRDAEVLIGKIRAALKEDRPTQKRWPVVVGAAGLVVSGYVAAALFGAPVPWWFGASGPSAQHIEAKRVADAEAAAAKKRDDELVAANRATGESKRIADGIAAEITTTEAKRVANAAAAKQADDERTAKAAADAKQKADAAALRKQIAETEFAKRLIIAKLEVEFAQLVETGTADQLAGFVIFNPSFAVRAEPVVARKREAEEAKRAAVASVTDRVVSNEPRPVTLAEAAKYGSDDVRALVPGSGRSAQDCWLQDGKNYCGPKMVVVPAGAFTMGSPVSEPERQSGEAQVSAYISRPFAAGQFAVTFDEWDACVDDGGCGGYRPEDQGWGRGKRPVINVTWDHAKSYVTWLSRKTGKSYRLLSEAEREYVARAGTTTPFWWGPSITPKQANYKGSLDPYKGGGSKGEYRQQTVPVDSFAANPWGLYNVHGNVWEWTEDCWNDGNSGNSGTGGARTSGDCGVRILRGGSWLRFPQDLRSANRNGSSADSRSNSFGFRVGRTITP